MTKLELTINSRKQGWGPIEELPELLKNLPYAPYNKQERLGRVADWTAPEQPTTTTRKRNDQPTPTPFTQNDQQDDSFSIVDRANVSLRKSVMRFNKPSGLQQSRTTARNAPAQRGPTGQIKRPVRYNDKPRARATSIKVGASWKLIEELDFARMAKLYFDVEEPQDLAFQGSVNYYDKSFDRITVKTNVPLQHIEKVHSNPTASDDKYLLQLAQSDEKVVIATDSVLATLMCCHRSIYPWDVVITKRNNTLIFDKREGSTLDLVTVNENAAEPPVDSAEKDTNINSHEALAQEATSINRYFSQQSVVEDSKVVFSNDNSHSTGILASAGYRYRKWALGEDLTLVMRTKVDAAILAKDASPDSSIDIESSSYPMQDTQFVNIYALNEFDSRAVGSAGAPDWRQKLDAQRGAVIATEMKNNSNKLSRWTLESLLSGVDFMRIGFVTRANPKDRKRHQILGTTTVRPEDFADQINLNVGNGWGIIKVLADLCFERFADGKFIIVRDPVKPLLRFYQVSGSAHVEIVEEADENEDEDEDQ
ncbi:eukaryotic translation initiation factor 3 subunit D [Globomyces pollinis-pini]|nr:eukaryotic translation initiation factor 3 subunit D [Globomyces pollinis-pini]